MAYNVFEYETSSDAEKKTALFNVINPLNPDILIGVEIDESPLASDHFRIYVLNSSVTDKYFLGTSPLTSATGGFSNFAYFKPEKFTFLSSSIIIDNDKWPTLQFQLYNNLTGNKIIIYGAHFTSGSSNQAQRNAEAQAIRNSTFNLASSSYFIVAGDLNLVASSSETAYSSLLNQTTAGYFLDSGGFDASFNTYNILNTFDRRFDLILISQSVPNAGGVKYVSNSFAVDGNDGGNAPGSGSDYAAASDHLPVFADFTFDFPTTKNPPYPGSIVFTQVGATNPDVIEFITLYRMDLTTLKITDNSIDSDGDLSTDEGTFDLSNTNWTDVPAGTFVRLDATKDTTDNDASDRILYYGTTSGSVPSLDPGGEQLIAYTGSSPIPDYYISGINWGNSGGWLSSPTGITSYAPGTPSDIELGSLSDYAFNGNVDDILYVTRNALISVSDWTSFTGGVYNNLSSKIGNSALPVELAYFAGTINSNNVELRWRTETEVNNYGFDIERTKDNSDWLTIGFVEGHGNSNSPKQYDFIDTDINLSGTYYYRLKQIDNDGTYEYSDVISVEVGIPSNFYLSQNYPNPFNPNTRIDFTLPEKQLVSLRIYNTLGELVNEERETGSYSVTFDASRLPSGVYIYRLQTSEFAENKKMTFLK